MTIYTAMYIYKQLISVYYNIMWCGRKINSDTLQYTLTREPHDELHPGADVDRPESVDKEGEGEDVGRPTNKNQDQTPDDQTEAERGCDGEHLHTNVQEHHRLCIEEGVCVRERE